MPTVPLTKSKHLFPFVALLAKQGEPVGRLLLKAGLPGACLDDPDMLVPVASEGRFRELAAQKSGGPNIALAANQPLEIEDLGDFGQALLRAPTLHRSLSELRRLIATETSNLTIDLHPQPGGDLSIGLRFLLEAERGEWHNTLYVLTWMLKVVRLAEPAWSPSEISIRSTAAPTRFEAIETLGAAARFEQHLTGFVVPASMLALPLTRSPTAGQDPVLQDEHLWSTAPPGTYTEALRRLVRSYASDGWLSVEQASEVANTSVRTMQRRLSAERATYSGILEQTRAQMAGELLEGTDATIAEIAHQLGYDYQGDFTRAFRRWAEVPPSEFRRQRRRMKARGLCVAG